MDKKELDSVINYNEHAIFMSEIALAILNRDKSILDVKGVKEIIAMYLLIPYITRDRLDKPSSNNSIPLLDLNEIFTKIYEADDVSFDIKLGSLRNSICHSYVTVEDKDNGYIIIDDRAIYSTGKEHSSLQQKSRCLGLSINLVEVKLKALHNKIIKLQKDFNKKLKKDNGYADE